MKSNAVLSIIRPAYERVGFPHMSLYLFYQFEYSFNWSIDLDFIRSALIGYLLKVK
jgi:hypothetical protein